MLCVPRSVSPIDVRQAAVKGPPSSASSASTSPIRSKLFTRTSNNNKDATPSASPVSLRPPLPTPTTASPSSNTSATSSTACSSSDGGVPEDSGHGNGIGHSPVSISKKPGSKWLASLRGSSSPSTKRPLAKDAVADQPAAVTTVSETGTMINGSSSPSSTSANAPGTPTSGRAILSRTLLGHKEANVDSSETSAVSGNNSTSGVVGGKKLSSILGSLSRRPKESTAAAAPEQQSQPQPPQPTRASSRPTPSPLPLQPRKERPRSLVDLQSESDSEEEDEDEDETSDDELDLDYDDFADVTLDVYPGSSRMVDGQPSSPSSIFYPTTAASKKHQRRHNQHHHGHTGHHHHRPGTNTTGDRKQGQPLRSHVNLLQITTASLQPTPSPHPLITAPRSSSSASSGSASGPSSSSSAAGNSGPSSSSSNSNSANSNNNNGAPVFPRSCNLSGQLPPARSVLVTLQKSRIICRLESPGSLTAAEELSIMPFATRVPGSVRGGGSAGGVGPSSSSDRVYPSSGRSRSSLLMRNLALEDGDLIREVDVGQNGGPNAGNNASTGGNSAYPTFSRGLKRWLARPPFEQRMVMWTPAPPSVSFAGDNGGSPGLGVVRSPVPRAPLVGPAAPLEFSEGVEALAGVSRARRVRYAVGVGRPRAVTQVVAPLHHPKPTAAGAMRFGKPPDGSNGPALVIPPPPLLSSSPSSTTSLDTAPNTPGGSSSNNNSAQNLTSLVPPAFFLKRLRQSAIAYVDPNNISDEDDVPLGVVVINKHGDDDRRKPVASPGKNDPQERARRMREKEKERDALEKKKKAFKDQIMSSRVRREAHRAGGRFGAASLSQDWIEVDGVTAQGRSSSSAPPRTATNQQQQQQRSATIPAPVTSSSAQSIRSMSSAKSRSNSVARPPSVVGSERSWQSGRTSKTAGGQSQQPQVYRQNSVGVGMMNAPIMVYNSPFSPVMMGNPNANASMGPGAGGAMMPPYPPQFFAPPPPPLPSTNTTKSSSKSSNGSRRDSGYGEFGQSVQSQNQSQKGSSGGGQGHFWTMPSRRGSSKSDEKRKSSTPPEVDYFSGNQLQPPRPKFAASQNSSSESFSDTSVRSGRYSTASRRSSVLVGRNIN